MNAAATSVTKGESLQDTALTLRALGVDAFVLRHPAAGAAHQLARWVDVPVVNGGDGNHAHPTQALGDAVVLCERFGEDLTGRHVVLLGDAVHYRVARSLVRLLPRLGVRVTLCGPPGLVPADGWGQAKVTHRSDVLEDADVCYVLRFQADRGAPARR